jgi:hypothetical protein
MAGSRGRELAAPEVAVPEQNPPQFVMEAVLGFLMGPPVDGPAIDGPNTSYFCTFSF